MEVAAANGLSIGEVSRATDIPPSTLRYYERIGLLPEVPRAGGKRRYPPAVLEQLAGIRLAKEAGFSLDEVRKLIREFPPEIAPSERWATLASRKEAELDTLIERAEGMKAMLREGLECRCRSLSDCPPVQRRISRVRESGLLPK